MITDPIIREQAYQYFLEEAPELLHTIEQELFSLNDDSLESSQRPLKVNRLMRATHTLKGGAANVGLETIKIIAHSLEDLYKALYNPELEIDLELQTLLFESYECLRLPLTAELSKVDIDHSEILDRAANIFAQLQDKFGDYLTDQDAFPSSSELGLDIVESLFKEIVPERLQELSAALNQSEVTEVAEVLQSQAEVFVGLAESLNLPGLQAIASNILIALDCHPDRVIEIAEVALDNLQQAQQQVLAGDRERGGEPSSALLQLADPHSRAQEEFTWEREHPLESLSNHHLSKETGDLVHEVWGQEENESEESANEIEISSQNTEQSFVILNSSSAESSEARANQLMYEIWGQEIHSESAREESTLPETNETENQEPILSEISSTSKSQERTKEGKTAPVSQTVRINLDSLDRLNNLMGELLIDQNKNSLKHKNVYNTVQALIEKLNQNEQIISSLSELFIEDVLLMGNQSEKWRNREGKNLSHDAINLLNSAIKNNLESIEMAENIRTFNQQSHRNIQKQQRILLNMRDELIETRMSPVSKVFNRFLPMIEQLAKAHGKKIEFKIIGGHTLVDKAIEDKLYDPLLHLVRNAFDHGIETPEVRSQLGKKETGKIELRAYYQGSQTIIEVQDDGNGLNLEKIKKRAIELNFLPDHLAEKISESQILEFLFEPGFSTAAKVSDLSGRGVGLDVVRSQIETMKGNINIESIPKEGTTFSLQIPITLTIAKLMLCEAKGVVYALLIDAIERIVLPTTEQIQVYKGQKVLQWETATDSELIPVRKLSESIEYSRLPQGKIAGLKTEEDTINNPILLLRNNTELLGLEVDKVLGEQELVIRPLGSAIAPPTYVYGCSILSNSSLTLVIDATALIRETQRSKTYESQRAYLATPTFQALPTTKITPQLPPAGSDISEILQTLLVVDDSSSLRRTIKLSLQKINCQVLEAENGLKALERLRKPGNVSLVVCDLEMPHMNGFQFLKAVRQSLEFANLPIVVLTSRNSEKFRRLAQELGAAAYLTKPYNEEEFLNTVVHLLNQNTRA